MLVTIITGLVVGSTLTLIGLAGIVLLVFCAIYAAASFQ